MREDLSIQTEQVDDIPLLLSLMQRLNLPDLLDAHFPTHGNWKGASLGWTASVWLAYILSRGDHRLNQVQDWVAERPQTLQSSTGQPVRPLDWSDDRLALVLDALQLSAPWQAFEQALNAHTIRVYRLTPERVRLDSTTASGYWRVTEDGYFQLGHSKDGRPDQPQLKVMLSVLDPLGLPVATQVAAGNRADGPLYRPAIEEVQAGVQAHGLLYVGDSKMAALATRSYLQDTRNSYLCPLAEAQLSQETLAAYLQPVWDAQQPLTGVTRVNADGERQLLAEGYERSEEVQDQVGDRLVQWTERRLVLLSLHHAQAQADNLNERLRKAQAALAGLRESKRGKPRLDSATAVENAVTAILKRYRVDGLFRVTITERMQERQVRSWGGRPARTAVDCQVSWQADLDTEAVAAAQRWFGWRVYATNHPADTLSMEQAVLAYRDQYLIEHGFSRLKGAPLALTPLYLQSDERTIGLVHLLSLGLRVLTLLEYQVRTNLAHNQERLAGLYAGNPKRATQRPTAEALLAAFRGIYLSTMVIGGVLHRHITPLSPLHRKILTLLELPLAIYTQLPDAIPVLDGQMTEP